jgi:hypothetical protein
MATDAKINANRENAKHSTGPRTDEGKARSSFNATRHGLTGQVNVRTEEEQKARTAHCDGFFQDWKPQGATECHLVQTMADKQWQIHRADAWLDSIFALGHADFAGKIDVEHPQIHAALTAGLVTMARTKELDLIGRYASRLQRDYRNALKDLQNLQAQRQQREKDEMRQAAELAKFCKMKKEPYNPADFGFVSRTSQIDIYTRRQEYIEQAAIAAKYDFNLEKYRTAVQ